MTNNDCAKNFDSIHTAVPKCAHWTNHQFASNKFWLISDPNKQIKKVYVMTDVALAGCPSEPVQKFNVGNFFDFINVYPWVRSHTKCICRFGKFLRRELLIAARFNEFHITKLVGRAPDLWLKCCELESRQEQQENFLLKLNLRADSYFGVRSIPALLQWHVKDPGHSAISAGGMLHLNTHTPLSQQSRIRLTMLLSRHSVEAYQEMS